MLFAALAFTLITVGKLPLFAVLFSVVPISILVAGIENREGPMTGPSAPLALTVHLAWVSSISFGGFPTVLPDVRNFVVGTNRWMTDQEFANLFAMAQSIPGQT